MSNNHSPIIEFQKVSFTYDSQAEANLNSINFSIYPGESVLIIGASGSGKSTLAKCLNGQIPHSYPGQLQGNILINGESTSNLDLFSLSTKVGTVLQDTDGQFVGLTVAEDIAFALENDNAPQDKMINTTHHWANTLGIVDQLNHNPGQLSGGQKQRVALAGVLVDTVPILVFDEPLANLDPESAQETMQLINHLHHSQRLTTVIIEHRLEEALTMDIDRILVIHEGQLLADTTPDALLRSTILETIGIRRPLYLQALAYADVDLAQLPHPIGAFNASFITHAIAEKLRQWVNSSKPLPPKVKTNTLIELDNITFRYSETATLSLNNLSLKLNQGEMVSIVGPNGAGKSTLAKLLSGFIRPESGRYHIQSLDSATLSVKEIADTIGYVMQNPNHMISKTQIFDEVALGLINRNVDPEIITERVNQALQICGLYPYRNWPIHALSYGQKRRVTIASILTLDPAVIILDEPTAGQDYRHYIEMMAFLSDLNRSSNMTILMISHDMHLIQEYSDRTLVIGEGELLADLPPAELLTNLSLLNQANLRPTSLYLLEEHINAPGLTQAFIRARGSESHE